MARLRLLSAALVRPSLVPRPWCRYRVGRVEFVEDVTEEGKEAEVSPPCGTPAHPASRPACLLLLLLPGCCCSAVRG